MHTPLPLHNLYLEYSTIRHTESGPSNSLSEVCDFHLHAFFEQVDVHGLLVNWGEKEGTHRFHTYKHSDSMQSMTNTGTADLIQTLADQVELTVCRSLLYSHKTAPNTLAELSTYRSAQESHALNSFSSCC